MGLWNWVFSRATTYPDNYEGEVHDVVDNVEKEEEEEEEEEEQKVAEIEEGCLLDRIKNSNINDDSIEEIEEHIEKYLNLNLVPENVEDNISFIRNLPKDLREEVREMRRELVRKNKENKRNDRMKKYLDARFYHGVKGMFKKGYNVNTKIEDKPLFIYFTETIVNTDKPDVLEGEYLREYSEENFIFNLILNQKNFIPHFKNINNPDVLPDLLWNIEENIFFPELISDLQKRYPEEMRELFHIRYSQYCQKYSNCRNSGYLSFMLNRINNQFMLEE